MDTTNVDFPSRISFRGIVAGILTTFAAMMFFMTLAAGFGVWTFDFSEVHSLGTGFWAWAFVSWIISVGVGAFVSALSGRSGNRVDGLLHGTVTWAGACVAGCLTMAIAGGRFSNFASSHATPSMFWWTIFGDALALIGTLWAGTTAVGVEHRARQGERHASAKRAA